MDANQIRDAGCKKERPMRYFQHIDVDLKVWVIRVNYIVSVLIDEGISCRCLLVEKSGDPVTGGVSESRCPSDSTNTASA